MKISKINNNPTVTLEALEALHAGCSHINSQMGFGQFVGFEHSQVQFVASHRF